MPNNNKNQSRLNKNKLNNKQTKTAKELEQNPNPLTHKVGSLPYIHELIASDPELQQQAVINALEKIYRQLSMDIKDSEEIKAALKHIGQLYNFEDARQFLRIIIINAFLGTPSYISHENIVAKVMEVDDQMKIKLGLKVRA